MLVFCCFATCLPENPHPSQQPTLPRNHPVTGAKLYTIQPGLEIEPKGKQIYLETRICLDSGILEFFLIQGKQKAYESILTTEASPSQLMSAMLLLGWKPNDALKIILLSGKDTLPISRLIRNRDVSVAPAKDLGWSLLGSNYADFQQKRAPFAADQEGIHMALIDRSEALVEFTGGKKNPYHNSTFGYEINRASHFKVGTAITLIFQKTTP
jgi:hypothetical protein